MMRLRFGFPAVLLLGASLLAGCRSNVEALRQAAVARAATAPVPGEAAPDAPPPSPPPQALEAPLPPLTSLPGSVGIVVCEPVPKAADAAAVDFGAGCGRWLFFTVGGPPELGQTPLWSEVERARMELGKSDLRLALPDAVRLGGALGVTHVAVGTIAGSAAHCTLSYQIWAVPHGRAVGGPFVVAGTQAQVLARLPALARQMAHHLGVAAPRVPAAVGARPADVVLAGQVPWGPEETPNSAQAAALQSLSARWPLAALLALNTGLRGDQKLPFVANALLTQAPDNPLGYAQLGYVQPAALRPYSAVLAAYRRRFPNNYALAHADVWWGRESKNPQAEHTAALQTARDAPRNPDAWLTLGYTLSDEAARVRKGRTVGMISAQEWQYLDTVYARWLAAVSRAARLDPRYGRAWARIAEAATFDGQSAIADRAFWNALRWDPDHADVYGWGLEMYQEKWGGDPMTLAKVAGLAAADHYPTVGEAVSVADDL
ncbi:MAG: hypothetical protein JO250_18915, partial [Armatimonadetes bacterium]|nr:hypothetical protein [Armatimonadota bacterium]